MHIQAVKTEKILAGCLTIFELLDKSLASLANGDVVAITSKVVGICEGRVVPIGSIDKQELVRQEAEYYLPLSASKYGLSFTITHGTLVPVAGIDESNGNGNYVLWPADPQASANSIREYLVKRFNLKKVGVVITDSTARPLHYGTEGVAISFSGFVPNNNYIGKPDLFGRPFKISISNIADGLAAAAVLVMGEGTEQTPVAVIKDVPFVKFSSRNPTKQELESFYLPHMEDDLFAPFLRNAGWLPGDKQKK